MPEHPVLVWFRQDLRLADNPALNAAAKTGRPMVAAYIRDDTIPWQPGGASRRWLHMSLTALRDDLKSRYGIDLVLRRGDPAAIIPTLAAEIEAGAVYWNRCYEPAAIARDAAIKVQLQARGISIESGNSALLFEPWTVQTQAGGWFKVFTPFWRVCQAMAPPQAPLARPAAMTRWSGTIAGDGLDDWQLLPAEPDWAGGLRASWQPGETGAAARLARFLDSALGEYAEARDRPARESTSRLSPHLHFGEIGPRQIWHALHLRAADKGAAASAEKFRSELGWREFSHHLLYHFPALPEQNFRDDFDAFPWSDDAALLQAWQHGRTGYPIVDAGMRELWQTGWMHNRVRMITASFLVKHLRQHWRSGAAWFWDTLVDADLANNSASWQWVAGCGADAAPYFRIFNPVLQGEKFDPDGAYVRHWIPEIARLPDRYLHKPWLAPAAILDEAGVTLGKTYPQPLVDHARARQAALAAYSAMRNPG